MANKIGIIGYGGQGKRIEKILNEMNFSIEVIYKPSAKKNDTKCSSNFEELKKCDIIFICSPNHEHFNQIRAFKDKCYIFCEKTPVSDSKDLLKLKKYNHDKIFYNFNMRFTLLSEMLLKMKDYGQIVGGFITLTHGLAGEEKYKNSWRSNKKICPKGVFEVISIHAIDLIKLVFEDANLFSNKLMNLSDIGDAPDTSNSSIKFNNNSEINILASYYAPYNFEWFITFENGIFRANEKKIEILGPRRTFDDNNFFKKPEVIESIKIDRAIDYNSSLLKSVTFFMDHALNNKKFNKSLSDVSLSSNLSILE